MGALRVRLGHKDQQRPPGLTQLLDEAVRQGAFRDDKFRDWPGHRIPELDPSGDWFAEKVIGLVRELRNSFAHGSSTLMPDGGFSLRIVADAINQLYAS